MNKGIVLAGKIFGGILILLLGLLVFSGFIPVPIDAAVAPEDYGAGASSVLPSYSGLLREFPPVNQPVDVPVSPEMEELGRLLFFDPILSKENDISCATCHHPDFGFGDGLPQAVGRGGTGAGPARQDGINLPRNTPSLWNSAYSTLFFWDGRVNSLEEQALNPLLHPDEMAVDDTTAQAEELKAIPYYADLFSAAFSEEEDPVTIDNAIKAIAAFERTLVSANSPFDRYAQGEIDALSPSQRRGLNLFRSAATRCFECHTAPTFSTDTFRVIGAPDFPGMDPDLGRAAVLSDGEPGAFKVPSLRNAALTAPYMHSGAIADLAGVIDFYASADPATSQAENLDPFIQGFELTDQEKEDLVAFLFALTDESNMPEIPDKVPSGLSVVPRLDNPLRALAAEYNQPGTGTTADARAPRTLMVSPGDNIQLIADEARPGDTIMIEPGIYYQRVAIDINDITIYGIADENGVYPTLDGENKLSEAIISSGNNFEAAYLRVVNYTDNGILVEGVTGVYLHDIYAENTGTYGLYPVKSTDVLIEDSEVVGANDAGIYAGQSENVVVRNNVVYENVLGIELENTVNGEVYSNHAYNNTNAILIVVLPQLTSKVSLNTKVYDNLLEDNNHANFAKQGTAASIMPAGSGIALVGSDQVEVYNNTIKNNKTAGIGIFSLLIAYDANEVNVGPTPENIRIYGNHFENNGYDPDEFISNMGIPGADLLWDVSGDNVRVNEPQANVFPPSLPKDSWSIFVYRVYWQVLNFLIGLM